MDTKFALKNLMPILGNGVYKSWVYHYVDWSL
jgi:hypothetical protein